MEELNKKLAEWAGFRWWSIHPQSDLTQGCEYQQLLGDEVLLPDDIGDMPTLAITENDKEIGAPIFTQSLDACFKWLVPKLDRVQITFNEAPSGDIFWNALANDARVTSETPALALCKAIEKLIDGEKDA